MNTFFRFMLLGFVSLMANYAFCQELSDFEPQDSMEVKVLASPKYGFCSFSQILHSHPAYFLAQDKLSKLREQYEKEAEYNEIDFRRQFSEYLNGQKEFPQSILLKRQRDLQESMEKGLAFRAEADSMLNQAEHDLMQPICDRIQAAIKEVATERHYEYIIDTDKGAFLYLTPLLSEDITIYVEEKLK